MASEKRHLSDKWLARQPSPASRRYVFDTATLGFVVAIHPSGKKTFYYYRRVNGKPRRIHIGNFPSLPVHEARAEANEKQALIDKGQNPFVEKKKRGAVPTFHELTEAYILSRIQKLESEKRLGEKIQTAEARLRWRVKRHFVSWRDRPIDTITIEDVLTVKRLCENRQLLANRAIEFVRAIFNWSGKTIDGKVNFWPVANPAIGVALFKDAEKERERFLEPVELVRFNTALKNEKHVDLADFLVLAMTTAARKSDLFSLRWEDVKWERRVWFVPFPKNGKSYEVTLLPAALEVLKRRRARVPETATYVFPGPGKTGHLLELRRPWDEFRKRAEIAEIRIHDLRRSAASYMAMAGMSLHEIAGTLGQKSLGATSIYARLHVEAQGKVREKGQKKMNQMMLAAKKRQKALPAAPKEQGHATS